MSWFLTHSCFGWYEKKIEGIRAGEGTKAFDIDCETVLGKGGCPDQKACYKTCLPCHQGHQGEVYSVCINGLCHC